MSSHWFELLDPITRTRLQFSAVGEDINFGYWSSNDSPQTWPMALGISFLRVDRAELAQQVCTLIKMQDFVSAVALLLQDTDDFAPAIPPLNECLRIAERLLVDDKKLLACDMMQALEFGPVANYFALRGSAPTFLSGLGLLKLGVQPKRPLIEVGCGVGHFLSWLTTRGITVLGTDSVFSKLCLASRYMGIKPSHLLCAVSGKKVPLPLETFQPSHIFCHDVFYFIKDKLNSIADFRRLAHPDGSIMIGHAHLATADHGSVSGHPLSIDAYRQIATKDAYFFDDAALVSLDVAATRVQHEIAVTAEAISFIEGKLSTASTDNSQWWDCADEILFAPLQVTWSDNARLTTMNWPSEAFAQEYQASDYLTSTENPFEYLPFQGHVESLPLHPGLAVSAPFFALGVKPLRWGIIGGGWIAADYFVPAFQFCPHARLVAVCDVKSERLNAFSHIPGLRTFSNLGEMLATCELDAVYIATPNCFHAEIFEVVAAHGIRILCEKPIATNQPDIDKIHACIHQSPTLFQAAFDQRYHPAHVQLARRIADGVLGTVTQVRIHYACWLDDGWSKVSATENWRVDPNRAGGGAGFDLLPHCLDLMLMLTDDTVAAAHLLYQGRVHEYSTDLGVDDGALMTVMTHKGILVSMHVGYNCPENQPRRRIEIFGTLGRVEAHNTMGQDAGGELVWQIQGSESRETFPAGLAAGPFVRQLDMLSRQWMRGDSPRFPIERDIELAKCLIRCDSQAKEIFNLQGLRS